MISDSSKPRSSSLTPRSTVWYATQSLQQVSDSYESVIQSSALLSQLLTRYPDPEVAAAFTGADGIDALLKNLKRYSDQPAVAASLCDALQQFLRIPPSRAALATISDAYLVRELLELRRLHPAATELLQSSAQALQLLIAADPLRFLNAPTCDAEDRLVLVMEIIGQHGENAHVIQRSTQALCSLLTENPALTKRFSQKQTLLIINQLHHTLATKVECPATAISLCHILQQLTSHHAAHVAVAYREACVPLLMEAQEHYWNSLEIAQHMATALNNFLNDSDFLINVIDDMRDLGLAEQLWRAIDRHGKVPRVVLPVMRLLGKMRAHCVLFPAELLAQMPRVLDVFQDYTDDVAIATACTQLAAESTRDTPGIVSSTELVQRLTGLLVWTLDDHKNNRATVLMVARLLKQLLEHPAAHAPCAKAFYRKRAAPRFFEALQRHGRNQEIVAALLRCFAVQVHKEEMHTQEMRDLWQEPVNDKLCSILSDYRDEPAITVDILIFLQYMGSVAPKHRIFDTDQITLLLDCLALHQNDNAQIAATASELIASHAGYPDVAAHILKYHALLLLKNTLHRHARDSAIASDCCLILHQMLQVLPGPTISELLQISGLSDDLMKVIARHPTAEELTASAASVLAWWVVSDNRLTEKLVAQDLQNIVVAAMIADHRRFLTKLNEHGKGNLSAFLKQIGAIPENASWEQVCSALAQDEIQLHAQEQTA